MNELDKLQSLSQLVVKHNDLIRKTQHSLTLNQQKFLCYLISKIKPEDPSFKVYEIKVSEYCELMKINKDWFYSDFKTLIDDFDNNTFWIEDDEKSLKFRFFDITSYSNGTINISLSTTLKVYLLRLKENFTAYEFYNIVMLKSKHAIALFELLKSYNYKSKKEFTPEELQTALNSPNYKKFYDFKRFVLEPAIKQINELTELNISIETKRIGKKTVSIIFYINNKTIEDTFYLKKDIL